MNSTPNTIDSKSKNTTSLITAVFRFSRTIVTIVFWSSLLTLVGKYSGQLLIITLPLTMAAIAWILIKRYKILQANGWADMELQLSLLVSAMISISAIMVITFKVSLPLYPAPLVRESIITICVVCVVLYSVFVGLRWVRLPTFFAGVALLASWPIVLEFSAARLLYQAAASNHVAMVRILLQTPKIQEVLGILHLDIMYAAASTCGHTPAQGTEQQLWETILQATPTDIKTPEFLNKSLGRIFSSQKLARCQASIGVLVAAGANVNLVFDGKGALHRLLEQKDKTTLQAISALLDLKADVNIVDDKRKTPLMYALSTDLQKRDMEIIRALLQAGADVNVKDSSGTPAFFFDPNSEQDLEIQAMLLDYGVDPILRDSGGMTWLHFLFSQGIENTDYIKGQSLSEANTSDMFLKVHQERFDIFSRAARAIIKAGGKLNTVAANTETPLIFAIRSCSSEAVKLAFQLGAHPRFANSNGENASSIAANMVNLPDAIKYRYAGVRYREFRGSFTDFCTSEEVAKIQNLVARATKAAGG